MKRSLVRPVDCHKGDFGHLLVIAGSRGMAGAALLTVMAALRSGAGKTTWVTTEGAYRAAARAIPEAMSLTFAEARGGGLPRSASAAILRLASKATAIAAGPGLGRTPEVRALICTIVRRSTVPLVLDADALWALEGEPRLLKLPGFPPVITPHDGEFARLFQRPALRTNTAGRSVAKTITNQYHCVLVRKGPRSWVVSPDGNIFVNPSGNPGLAKGGSGDVLTGIIGALLAQGFEPWTAACIGAYAHGRAADLAVRKSSRTSLVATDLLAALPAVWARLEQKRDLFSALHLRF